MTITYKKGLIRTQKRIWKPLESMRQFKRGSENPSILTKYREVYSWKHGYLLETTSVQNKPYSTERSIEVTGNYRRPEKATP